MCDWLPKLDDTAIVAVLQSAHESLSMVDHVKKNCHRSKNVLCQDYVLKWRTNQQTKIPNEHKLLLGVRSRSLVCCSFMCACAQPQNRSISHAIFFFLSHSHMHYTRNTNLTVDICI